jgi:ribulose 1,5-bisphosphate synthetase/thiazole synthase
MRNLSTWIDDTAIRKFPKFQGNTVADVLVIGGGGTGITAAHLLNNAGATAAVIDRYRIASMDTGHKLLTLGTLKNR